MKTRTKVTIGVLIALALAAAALVAVGVLTHEEPGLLGACFDGGAVVRYEPDGPETCPEVRWDPAQVPIAVRATTDNPHPPIDPAGGTREAIAAINARLGFALFRYVDAGPADVVVLVGVPVEVGAASSLEGVARAGGDASHRIVAGRLRAEVRTANTGTAGLTHRVLVHELLHAAGLAHDPFEDSAMFAPVPVDDGPRLRTPWITDADRDLLRRLYARP